MSLHLNTELVGKVDANPYNYTRNLATLRVAPLRGSPRYRSRDIAPSFIVRCQIRCADNQQFAAWESFWQSIGDGAEGFVMRIILGGESSYEDTLVHANGPYSAVQSSRGHWTVDLPIEVANADATILGTLCNVIYGGPIWALGVDDIYGGPIDNLAIDVIDPCPGVLNGN